MAGPKGSAENDLFVIVDAPLMGIGAFGAGDGELGAAFERIISDGGDTVGEINAGQAVAVCECLIFDGGDTVGQGDAGQAAAA